MSPGRRSLVLVMIAALLAASLPGLPARADEQAAREHFDRAEILYAQGEFEGALAEYLDAYAAEPLPELLFNVGQCQRNLDRYGDAIFSFRRYLELRPDAPNRAAVHALIDELERKRQRAIVVRAPVPEQQRDDLVAAPVLRRARRPFYRSWWFITGVVVAGAAVTGVVLLANDDGSGGGSGGTTVGMPPMSDLGNVELPR
jgi:tetratricopeptide (TPR) repeat protein